MITIFETRQGHFFAILAKNINDDDATHGLIKYLPHVIFEFYARKIKIRVISYNS